MPFTAIAFAIVVISTAMFALWWVFLKPGERTAAIATNVAPSISGEAARPSPASLLPAAMPTPQQVPTIPQPEEEPYNPALVKEIKSSLGSLFLAGNTLMNAAAKEGNAVLKENWLDGPVPQTIWFDEESGKFIGRHAGGFARYNVNGSINKELTKPGGLLISDDLSLAVFADDGEIHTAQLNWREFELVQPKRITSIGGFDTRSAMQNVMMANKAGLILANTGQMVRVDLNSGAVTPTKVPMTQAAERLSPDKGQLIGEELGMRGQKLYVYEVATDSVKTADLGKARLNSTLWQNKNRCLALVKADVILEYNRETGGFKELMTLPKQFNRLAAPSPNGRYVLCLGTNSVGIADLEKKRLIPVNFPPQSLTWIDEGTLFMSRDIQSTKYRGTWVEKLDGSEAVRVSAEPYAFDGAGSGRSVLQMAAVNKVMFGTKSGYFGMECYNYRVRKFATARVHSFLLLGVEAWHALSQH